jgi:hypothetical protein
MNAKPLHSRITLAATVAIGATLLATSIDAVARERSAGAQRQAPRGDYTRHTERTRTDAGHVRRDTWTGADGRSATRDATVVNDRHNRQRTRDVAWQGPEGRTATRRDETTRTDDGYARRSTMTNAQGATITRDASVANDRAAGTRTREASTTLPDGRTRSLEDVTTRTDEGYVRNSTITNPNGSSLQRDVTATRAADTGSWTRDVSVDRTPAPPQGP